MKDIGALLDWIPEQPFLDKDRVMVTGPSYGGYMTYAVAAAYRRSHTLRLRGRGHFKFHQLLRDHGSLRLDDRRAEYGDDRDPAMREFLTRVSPVTQASKIRTPLLIAHGRQDTRVPVGQAEEMFRAVRANGAPAWLVIYEDEGHDRFPARGPNQNFNFYTWILFVQKYLLN